MSNHIIRDNEHSQLLCPKYRAMMEADIDYAETTWIRINYVAQQKTTASLWNEAVLAYGSSFEIAEILLRKGNSYHHAQPYNVNRYLHSALNLCFALRKCQSPANLGLLIAVVRDTLNRYLAHKQSELMLKNLSNMAFAPISEIQQPDTRFGSVKPAQAENTPLSSPNNTPSQLTLH